MILANAGVPMIFVQWPLMGYALVPIIVVELLVFRRVLHLGYKPALLGSALANILSTVVGVPISWGVAYGLERGIFESLPIGWIKHIYHTPPLKILLFRSPPRGLDRFSRHPTGSFRALLAFC